MTMFASVLAPLVFLSSFSTASAQRARTKEVNMTSLSCRDQCDRDLMLPCSCSTVCLAYHNCCQDFVTECPALVEAGRSIFSKSLNSEVICSQEAYFMIAGCPRGTDNILKEVSTTQSDSGNSSTHKILSESLHATGSSEFQDVDTFRSGVGSKKALLTQLENVPVTDRKTGLVFTNISIFLCHSGEQSQAIYWKAIFPLLSLEQPESMEHLAINTDATRIRYIPPTDVKSFLLDCIPVSIGTCKDDLVQSKPELHSRCGAYISYILFDSMIFDNLDCLQCNGISPDVVDWIPKLDVYPARTVFRLSVMFDIFDDVVRLRAIASGNTVALSWSTATCSLPSHEVLEAADLSSCVIDECAKGFIKRANGKCAILHQLLLAVASDDHPLISMEMRRLPRFVQCFMKDYLSYDVPEQATPLSAVTQYDENTGQTIYLTRLLLYLPLIIRIEMLAGAEKPLLKEIDTMFKIFMHSRKGKESNYNPETTHSSVVGAVVIRSPVVNWKQMVKSIFQGENVTANETTTSCAGSSEVNDFNGTDPIFLSNSMICWSNPIYERDEAAWELFKVSPCAGVLGSVASRCLPQKMVPVIFLGTVAFLLHQTLY